MTHGDRRKWEDRYRAAETGLRPPSTLLASWIDSLPCGRALDLASGDGRHALFLAARGFRVDAIDIAAAGLQRLLAAARSADLSVQVVQADLEHYALPRDRYDVVVAIRYLQRSLFEQMRRTVRPGGVVIVETFLIDQRQIGHPTNPDFLLEHGELRAHFHGFDVLVWEEGLCATEGAPAYLARLIARRPHAAGLD
ncbi:MAG: class I SAM-dependent methyltransferase [Candidatus Binatia bacterium]